MSIKVSITLILLILSTQLGLSNQKETISANVPSAGIRDSIDFYLLESERLIDSAPNLSLENARKAKQLSIVSNYNEGQAYASRLIGQANFNMHDYYDAEKQLKTALDFYKSTRKKSLEADIHYLLGQTHFHLNKTTSALEHFNFASVTYSENEENQKYANTLQSIGLVYNKLDELEKAEQYFYKSLAINKVINNNSNIAELYQDLGIVCYKTDNDSLATNYFNMAILFHKKAHNLNGIGINYSNIGLIELRKKNFARAYDNFKIANTYFTKSGFLTGQMWALNNMGACLASTGKLSEAENSFSSSLLIAYQIKSVEGRLTNLLDLSKYYEQTGNLNESLALQKQYTQLLDSSSAAKTAKRVNELETLYRLEHEERQLAELNAGSGIGFSNTLYILGIILIVTLIASTIAIKAFVQKRKAEKHLEEHRLELQSLIEQRTKELQEQISGRKTAEESDKLKSAFLTNMSHELRTPMNAIIAFSNFLREPDLVENQKNEYLDHINTAGDTLLSLIDDIIDIAKIESQQLKIFIQPTNINQLLNELHKVYSELRVKDNKKQIQFTLNTDKAYNYIINTDSKRLKQVISNLLENAFKYTEKGEIELGFNNSENSITFYVKDTGLGIPQDKQEIIFDRFSQLRNIHDKRTTHGTGLGLAICKNLSMLLGGTIHVESKEGSGSTFSVRIPVESIKKQVNTNYHKKSVSAKPTVSKYDWNELTILVAEDEDLNYKVLDSCLKRTKAHIIRARDGASAVEICKSQKVDIVLMDIQMPGMDGYEATQEIKKLNNRTPVIAQTSFAMVGEKERCLQAGCDDFVTKPLNIEGLLEKIESHLFCYARQKSIT